MNSHRGPRSTVQYCRSHREATMGAFHLQKPPPQKQSPAAASIAVSNQTFGLGWDDRVRPCDLQRSVQARAKPSWPGTNTMALKNSPRAAVPRRITGLRTDSAQSEGHFTRISCRLITMCCLWAKHSVRSLKHWQQCSSSAFFCGIYSVLLAFRRLLSALKLQQIQIFQHS